MKNSHQLVSALYLVFGFVAAGCAENPSHLDIDDNHDKDAEDPVGDTVDKQGNKPEDSVGGEETTFDHENDYRDPYEIALQQAEEGSPEVRSRLQHRPDLRTPRLLNLLRDV